MGAHSEPVASSIIVSISGRVMSCLWTGKRNTRRAVRTRRKSTAVRVCLCHLHLLFSAFWSSTTNRGLSPVCDFCPSTVSSSTRTVLRSLPTPPPNTNDPASQDERRARRSHPSRFATSIKSSAFSAPEPATPSRHRSACCDWICCRRQACHLGRDTHR